MLHVDEKKLVNFNQKSFKERIQLLEVLRLPSYDFDKWGKQVKTLLGDEAFKFLEFLERAFGKLQKGEKVDPSELKALNIPEKEFEEFFE